jgi:Tfp pilus assembly ATPase PilU
MQDFDSVIRDLIEQKVISLEDGLSYATNQNNLLLQLKGLSSTEDYVNTTGKPVVEPLAPPPPPPANANSVLDLME